MAVAIAALGAGAGLATPAFAAGSVMNATEHLDDFAPNGSWTWNVNRGESVRMRCWTTGAYVDGSGKWFYVYVNGGNPSYRRGYVPANSVSYQTTVGHC
jgi:hypothetical protein